MPLAEAPMAVLATAMRDPNVVIRYQAKIVTVPGSDCLWWRGAVSGRGHYRQQARSRPATATARHGTCGSSRTGSATPWLPGRPL